MIELVALLVGIVLLRRLLTSTVTQHHTRHHTKHLIDGKHTRNWCNSHKWDSTDIHTPTSLEEICDIVKEANALGRRVRAVGSLHSFNDCAKSQDAIMICTNDLNKILRVDVENNEVEVEAGIQLIDFYTALRKHKLALETLPNHGDFLLGGCVVNAVHGSVWSAGTMSSLVKEITLVVASGEVLKLRPGEEKEDEEMTHLFEAAVVGGGHFGVIYSVTMKTVPYYNMILSSTTWDYEDVKNRVSEIYESAVGISGYYNPPLGWFAFTQKVYAHPLVARDEERSKIRDFIFKTIMYHHKPKEMKTFFRGFLSGVMYYGLGKLRMQETRVSSWYDAEILVPSMNEKVGGYLSTEYCFPMENTDAVVNGVKDCYEKHAKLGHTRSFGVAFRPVGEDRYGYLSPTKGRERNVYMDLAWETYDSLEEAFMADIENVVLAEGGRPSWSRGTVQSGEVVLEHYEELDKYVSVLRKLDPEGMFSNEFRVRMFGE